MKNISLAQKRKAISAVDAFIIILLLLLSVMFLYPLYYILVAAFSDPLDVVKNPLLLIPTSITFYNFEMLMSSPTIWLGYRNTLLYMLLGTSINVILTMISGHALSQPELPNRKLFSFLFVLTMFFSGGMIPDYLLVKQIGLLNTIWAIVLPGAISTYNLLITRTYLTQQIPRELIEAAEVDGSGEYRTFLMIILPLAKPIIAVITLFYASSHWNAFFSALIYLQDRNLYPLQLYLREMLIHDQTFGMIETESTSLVALYTITLKYAVMTVSVFPLLIAFPFIQKFFVKGVMIGAIKG